MSNLIPVGPKKKVGFVCSGGATKAGAFHIGVALALQEQGFRFLGGKPDKDRIKTGMDIQTYVGSSAGSVIASYLAAGYSIDNIFNSFLDRAPVDALDTVPRVLPKLTYSKMFRINTPKVRDSLKDLKAMKSMITGLVKGDFESFLHFKWLRMTGFFTTDGIEQFFREDVMPSNRFEDYDPDLFIVATQLNHSRKVVFGKYSMKPPPHDLSCLYHNSTPISQAVAASTALPLIYAPYSIELEPENPRLFIDGEIRDTLSTHVAIDSGCDLVFASYTHQPLHFHKEVGSLTDHGLSSVLIQAIYLVIEQKINHHIHYKNSQKKAIEEVEKFLLQSSVSAKDRRSILEIMEKELQTRKNTDVIYIHPSPKDHTMFFGEHFSLSEKKLGDMVRSGFRAGIETLKQYDFQDKKKLKVQVAGRK